MPLRCLKCNIFRHASRNCPRQEKIDKVQKTTQKWIAKIDKKDLPVERIFVDKISSEVLGKTAQVEIDTFTSCSGTTLVGPEAAVIVDSFPLTSNGDAIVEKIIVSSSKENIAIASKDISAPPILKVASDNKYALISKDIKD